MRTAIVNRRFGVFAILSALFLVPAEGQAADIRAQIDRESPEVAEPFWLTVVVQAPPNAVVVFPEVPAEIGPFNVISHRDWFDVPVGALRQWTRNLQLESLQGGDLEVPGLPVSVDGKTLTSNTVSISIRSEIEAEADPLSFRDIKPQIDIPPPDEETSNLTAWVTGGLVIAAISAAVLLALRRKRPIAPGVWALQELDLMRESQNFDRERAPQLIPEIAGVLREYIGRQFDIRATRQTTEEFLANAQDDARFSTEQQTILKTFLQRVDALKFAKQTPEKTHLDESHRLVADFVRATSGDVR